MKTKMVLTSSRRWVRPYSKSACKFVVAVLLVLLGSTNGTITTATRNTSSISDVPGGSPNNDSNDGNDGSSTDCEILHNAKLIYEQHLAPRAMSDVLHVVVEKINREIAGVTNVQITWNGYSSSKFSGVGLHHVQTLVARTTTDKNRCFVVPMEILDTNECTLPPSHEWYQKCHSTALCVNTIGSYECLCPLLSGHDDPNLNHLLSTSQDDDSSLDTAITPNGTKRSTWETNLPSSSSSSGPTTNNNIILHHQQQHKCNGEPSTKFCCDSDSHSKEGMTCRSTFVCPMDPCSATTTSPCDTLATCKRSTHPWDTPNYICACPEGYIGNGHTCPPSDYYYLCGCKPIQIDPCATMSCNSEKHFECVIVQNNKPMCKCKKGYTFKKTTGECVSDRVPILRLKCCSTTPSNEKQQQQQQQDCTTTIYKQGDYYQECGVDIINKNADHDTTTNEDYRSLIIDYSNLHPASKLTATQCFTQVGTYSVTYKLAAAASVDDTANNSVSIVRTIVVQDVDECAYRTTEASSAAAAGGCPMVFLPRCDFDSGATCVNTVGSYTCKCPPFTVGDGFTKIIDDSDNTTTLIPMGYHGGTGCVDTTKPMIRLLGSNPKIFAVAKIEELLQPSLLHNKASAAEYTILLAEAQRLIRSTYGSQIQNIIDRTNGEELCRNNRHGSYSTTTKTSCVYAFDKTYNETIDLSAKVVIGNIVTVDDDDDEDDNKFRWKVPYNVMDAAGNEAETVYREIIVEEIGLFSSLEHDFSKGAEVEMSKMKDELKMLSNKLAISQKQQQQRNALPKCEQGVINPYDCEKYCGVVSNTNNDDRKFSSATTCIQRQPKSLLSSILQIWEQVVSVNQTTSSSTSPLFFGSPIILCMAVVIVGFAVLRSSWIVISGKRANRRNRWSQALEQEELALLENSVAYYKSPPPSSSLLRPSTMEAAWTAQSQQQQQQHDRIMSPLASRLFSPEVTATTTTAAAVSTPISNPDDIYASMSPITPSSRNRSVSSRSR